MSKYHTFKTLISPMDNRDLKRNFQKYRDKYWTKQGLYIPENVECVFEKIKRNSRDIGKPTACAEFSFELMRIMIVPEMASMYFAVHISMLHEMAHLYLDNVWQGRRNGHGKTFYEEIDRLYRLGAFRRLI